jgi:hypothetical protein
MRKLVIRKIATLGLVTATAVLGLPALAFSGAMTQGYASEGPEGPWCIIFGGSQGSVENCLMRTFEECREEAIAGNRGSCFPNPRFQGNWLPRSSSQHRPQAHASTALQRCPLKAGSRSRNTKCR